MNKTYPTRYSVDVISLKVPAIKTDVVTKTLHDKGFMILDEAMSDTSLLTVGQELENRVDNWLLTSQPSDLLVGRCSRPARQFAGSLPPSQFDGWLLESQPADLPAARHPANLLWLLASQPASRLAVSMQARHPANLLVGCYQASHRDSLEPDLN